MKNYFVYRLFGGDDKLLYVGQTGDFTKRIAQLKYNERFSELKSVSISVCESRSQARELEAHEIRMGKPAFNIQHNRYKNQMELF